MASHDQRGTCPPLLLGTICLPHTTQGYASGDPSKRGNLVYLAAEVGMFGLVGAAVKVGVDLLRSK